MKSGKTMHRKGDSPRPPILHLEVVKKSNGAYVLRGFSIKKLRSLEEYHRRHPSGQFSRKWSFSKDESLLVLL